MYAGGEKVRNEAAWRKGQHGGRRKTE